MILCGALSSPRTAYAQEDPLRPPPDSVTLQSSNGGRITYRCKILDYNGKRIRIETKPGNPPLEYPSEEVLAVKTRYNAAHREGIEAFAAGRFEEAAQSFRAALSIESDDPTRQWVRREIIAMLVRVALADGDDSAARRYFDILIASDPATRHFHLIPLAWNAGPVGAGEAAEARALLEKNRDAARLMGASVLLLDEKYGDFARTELRRLLSSPDSRIAELAAAQRWRLETAGNEIRRERLDEWRKRVEAMPAELRGGPYYVLARIAFDRREFDRAATLFLWLPLAAPADAHLAARSGVRGAESLVRLGQKAQAIRVLHDVIHRFAQTPFAQDAQSLIESFGKENVAP